MSEVKDYLELAAHNDEISKDTEKKCKAWGVITKYYAALHWINGFLLRKYPNQYDPQGHHSRLDFISKNEDRFYKPLNHLLGRSEKLRYCPPCWKEMKGDEVAKLNKDYEFIKKETNK